MSCNYNLDKGHMTLPLGRGQHGFIVLPLLLSFFADHPGWWQRSGQDLPSGSVWPGQVPPGVLHSHRRHWFHSKSQTPAAAAAPPHVLSLWWTVCTDTRAEPVFPLSPLLLWDRGAAWIRVWGVCACHDGDDAVIRMLWRQKVQWRPFAAGCLQQSWF